MKEPSKEPSLEDKITFFKELDSLHQDWDDSDGDAIPQQEVELRTRSRAFFSRDNRTERSTQSTQSTQSSQSPRTLVNRPAAGPKRTFSVPTPGQGPGVVERTPQTALLGRAKDRRLSTVATDGSFIEETPIQDSSRRVAQLKRSTTAPTPSSPSARDLLEQSSSAKSTMGKRKRNSLDKTIPESEQIFKGLSFFYVPNSDVSQVRKLRIAKAQEHGAQWTRNITDATHVIVDKNLKYKDLESLLVLVKENPSLILVYEDYPLDCIKFRGMLNADQFRYQIIDCPRPPPARLDALSAPPTSSQTSDKSLQLKARQTNPSKWDYVPPPGTPSRSEESSQPSHRRESQHMHLNHESSPGVWLAQGGVVGSPSPKVASNKVKEQEASPKPQNQQHSLEPPAKDELSDLIELAQQYKDLPLDEEDDQRHTEDNDTNIEDESGSDEEHSRKKPKNRRAKSGRKDIAFEERFACYQGGTKDKASQNANPNAGTIDILQKMLDYYERVNDNWRILAYRKAITTLRRQPVKINTAAEAEDLPGIGPRLSQKIEEIVSTNGLKRLEYAQKEPMDEVLQTFLKIYDVGLSTANKWIAQGYRTLDDLLQKANLTTNQRLGIEHYDDLNSRIPRSEVTALGEFVRKVAVKIDPQVELLIGGSYRRGSDSSGDIDFIVTKKGTTSSNDLVPFLQRLLAVLDKDGFIVATLAALNANRSSKEDPGSKWHGCCALPRTSGSATGGNADKPVWRRIDFLLVPETEYGAALIYFTGNDIFNRSIRLLASKKGMRLNQRGLFKDVMRGPGRQKVTEGDLVEGRDEKRIFDILGVKWREPSQRWC